MHLGQTARFVRDKKRLTLREAASKLGISHVHLCNIENNNVKASLDLLSKIREVYGVDLIVLAWCLYGDPEQLPPAVRGPMKALAEAWKREFEDLVSSKQEEKDE